MSTPPEGWLVCNGAAVAISDYPALYNAIGNTFLPEDVPASSAAFNLPNLMGKTPWGSTSVGTVLDAGLPNIAGTATYVNSDGVDQTNFPDTGCFFWGIYNHSWKTYSTNNGPAKRNLNFSASRSNSIYGKSSTVQPPALCLLPCIRYE
jgi:microcystin-dependent protein